MHHPNRSRQAAVRSVARPDPRPQLRQMLWGGLVGLAVLAAASMTRAQDAEPKIIKTYGYSFFGALNYPENFDHLDYVNPDAPRGGEIAISADGTFDSMNPYSRKGQAASLASIPFESLLVGVSDAEEVYYGLLAESLEYPEDMSWVIFHMRPEAKFSDGTPMTAHDVVFSHNLMMEQSLQSYREAVGKRVLGVEALDDYTVKYTFAPDIPRRALIDQVGGEPVFSKKWYEETGARLDESRMEPGIGSGPYILDSYDINRRVVYKRRDDYWGDHLPINKGRNNFGTIRVEYFADANAAMEGFKAGAYTFRAENSSRSWATAYDFPNLKDGYVVKAELPNGNIPAAAGFVFNLGKEKFQDIRVREAIGLAYNFEWTNKQVQFGLFAQRSSFWENSPVAAKGSPEGHELELLEKYKDLLPEGIQTAEPVMPHTSGDSQLDRKNLRKASKLLEEAGWIAGDDGIRRKDGQTLSLEIIEDSPTFDRIILPFIENLKALGVDAVYNRIDPAQYTNRRRDRDYDMIYAAYPMYEHPSTGLSQQFGSEDAAYSLFNPAGLADKGVDALIDEIVAAKTLEEIEPATRALDRVFRAKQFLIPTWFNDVYWVAYYDMYGHPETLPRFDLGYMDFWWYDAEKAEKLKSAGVLR
ncbi:extracellular solute-binding protein [Donghicola mangrovi]|nr:extracellular solute-binding protein [Donghicola mangrovi]